MELLLIIPVGIVVLVALALMFLFWELFAYGIVAVAVVAFVVEILKAVVGTLI